MSDRASIRSRRQFLGGIGGVGAAAVAGCLESNEGPDAGDSGGDGGGPGTSDTDRTGEPRVAGSWPMRRGDAQATGYAPGVGGPADAVEELWSVEFPRRGFATPVVREGIVYANDQGTVLALDAETGSERWRSSIGSDRGSAVAFGDDALYVGGAELHALDPADGEEIWRRDVGGLDPVVQGGGLYVRTGGVRCLDAATGEDRWDADLPGRPRRFAVSPDGRAFTIDRENVVRALDADGSRLWSYDLDVGRLRNGLAFGNGSLFVTNGHTTTTTALDPETGNERWSVDVPCNDAPAFDGDFLYVADLLGSVRKVDPATGAVVDGWGDVDVEYTLGDPIVTEDRLYALGYESTEDGAPYQLVALDSETGSERWRSDVGMENPGAFGATPLAVVEDVLYSTTEAELRAFAPA